MENRINGHTRLFCLIGSPVGHSGSPAMYNYSFDRLGLDNAYLAFDIPLEKTGEAVEALKLLHVGGFNITMPCKTEVAKYLDDLSPAARLIGACNTVTVSEDGKLTGHNTDGVGFVRNLKEHGVDVSGKKIVVLGAGGAANSVRNVRFRLVRKPCTMLSTVSVTAAISTGTGANFALPLSMRLMSSTSLISVSRCSALLPILRR